MRAIDAGATINDLLLTTLDLYVATANGLSQWDLLDPTTPSKMPAVFTTSSANVRSLALSGSTLFAADGDSSIEAFNISIPSIPNGVGTIASSLFGPTAVNATGGRLYISDGQATEIFTNIDGGGGTAVKVATDAFGAVAIAPITVRRDFRRRRRRRRVRAFDLARPRRRSRVFRVGSLTRAAAASIASAASQSLQTASTSPAETSAC